MRCDWCFGQRGASQVASLARIFRQVIKLILPAGLEMSHELPLGRSDHSHPGDLVMVHVVLPEERVIPLAVARCE